MNALREIDWLTILIWAALSTVGLVAIYSATQGPVSQFLPEYIQNNFSRQLLWVSLSIGGIAALQFIPPRTFQGLSWILYAASLLLMVLTVFFGTEVSGSRSWLRIGPLNLQTAEIMKLSTILAAANYLTHSRNTSASDIRTTLTTILIFLLPIALLVLQSEMGVSVIFIALLPFMLFWAGLPHGITLFVISPVLVGYLSVIGIVWGVTGAIVLTLLLFLIHRKPLLPIVALVIGIVTVLSTDLLLHQILQPHQAARIEAFVNPDLDPQGSGWNILQATTAIGSGGLTGKGFMEGTQTQLRFLPEQWTDFIFCVIGEEFGFLGASITITLFLLLFIRLLQLSLQHKYPFAQLVMVSTASVFFIHFLINIASATAIMPVIGLPLPFISYGGSSFLINSMLLGICLNLDLYKRSFSIYR